MRRDFHHVAFISLYGFQFLWQAPPAEQPEQPGQLPPQEGLPCFLSFIMCRITSATMTISTTQTAIVPKLPASHISIAIPPDN